jgi:hypothetical protein
MQRAEFQTSRHSHRAAVGDGQLPADISLTDNLDRPGDLGG